MTENIDYDWLAWGAHTDWQGFSQIIGTANEQIYKDYLGDNVPKFTEECHPKAKIIYIGFENDRFEEGSLCLVMFLFDEETGKGDWWRGSLSESYPQGGNSQGTPKRRIQSTLDSLARCGFKSGSNWMALAQEAFGKTIPIWVAEKQSRTSDRTFYIVQAIGVSGFASSPAVPWPKAQAQAFQPPAPQAQAVPPMPQFQPPAPQAQPVQQMAQQPQQPQQMAQQPPQAQAFQPPAFQQPPAMPANPFA